MTTSFAEKSVLIMGGATGIGRATARMRSRKRCRRFEFDGAPGRLRFPQYSPRSPNSADSTHSFGRS